MCADTSISTTAWVGAVMWLVQPLSVLAEFVAAARVTVPYSFVDNTISDLGASTCTSIEYPFGLVPVCSPWHSLLNGSFIIFGLFTALGAILIRRLLPHGLAATTSVVLWAISGFSSIATGLVPLDQDLALHVLVSEPIFYTQPLAIITLGLAFRPHRPALAWSSLAVGAITLAATAALLTRPDSPNLGGLLERVALWPVYVWMTIVAIAVLRAPRKQPSAVPV